MRKRQKRFNYGQRCTPVSLDAYSMDNVSVYNSVRRKALRGSKRSYGNPAFDDPVSFFVPLCTCITYNKFIVCSCTSAQFSGLSQICNKCRRYNGRI